MDPAPFDEELLAATVNVSIVDTETTGLDPGSDEVIGLAILCLRLDRSSGLVLGVVGDTCQWQQPGRMSQAAEATTRLRRIDLEGRHFDRQAVDALLAVTDLVVAHNAAVDRPFLEPLFPALQDLPWACSLTDIDWRAHGLPRPSIDRLLQGYGLAPSDGTPRSDCQALARILAMPLPGTDETGIHKLIAATARVRVECVLPGDVDPQARAILPSLGFVADGMRWSVDCADDVQALLVEMAVIDQAVDDVSFAGLRMWRVDAKARFTCRSGP
jgi:DNA polymerase-3 subunit epsilon